MQRVLEEAPKSIRAQNSDVPEWLEQFIGHLLKKDLADRFKSSEEVASLLEKELAYLRSPTTTEKPDRSWARHRSLAQRSQKTVSISLPRLAALVATTFLVVISWTIWPVAKEPTPKDSVGNPAPAYSGPAPVLWNADGTAELAERVQALAEQLHTTPSDSSTPNTWAEDIDELQRRLLEMNESESW
ncbi:MAG: hypothetical protein ACC628_26510 [Pirellulaceae bacterium]